MQRKKALCHIRQLRTALARMQAAPTCKWALEQYNQARQAAHSAFTAYHSAHWAQPAAKRQATRARYLDLDNQYRALQLGQLWPE